MGKVLKSRTPSVASRASSGRNSQSTGRDSQYTKSKAENPRQTLYRLQKRYRNLFNPLSQDQWTGCGCTNGCQPSTCSCLQDGAPCRQSCVCSLLCDHQFPPCSCETKCGSNCPCFKALHGCSVLCKCPGDTCNIDSGVWPKVEIRESEILSAGKGMFAAEPIEKKRMIARFEGTVEKHVNRNDFDLFDIANERSLVCKREGAYWINEKTYRHANAEYRYMEGCRRREIVAFAKRDIKAGEEIYAQYSDKTNNFPLRDPEVGDYVLICGERDDKKEYENWVGKLIGIDEKKNLKVQWLLRKEDLYWMPDKIRKKISLGTGELIMTTGWEATCSWSTFVQTVYVREGMPSGELNTNSWWWQRQYDAVKQKMVEEVEVERRSYPLERDRFSVSVVRKSPSSLLDPGHDI